MSMPGLLCRADTSSNRFYWFKGYFLSPTAAENGWKSSENWWHPDDFVMSTGKEIHYQGQDWHQWLHVRHNVLIWFLPVHLEAFYQV